MKDNRDPDETETLRPEYDFSGGVRGKYARQYAEGSNVVVLEPDVATVFHSSAAVNEALREVIRLRGLSAGRTA